MYLYYHWYWILGAVVGLSVVCLVLGVYFYHLPPDFSLSRFSPRRIPVARLSRVQAVALGFSSFFLVLGLVYLSLVGLGYPVGDWIDRSVDELGLGEDYDWAGSPSDCDSLLMKDLVKHESADRAYLMNELVEYWQDRVHFCAPEFWGPVAVDSRVYSPARAGPDGERGTQDDHAALGGSHLACARASIGGASVPDGLIPRNFTSDGYYAQPRLASGRDWNNNIIVYWDPVRSDRRPGDGALCWMYVEEVREWFQAYD